MKYLLGLIAFLWFVTWCGRTIAEYNPAETRHELLKECMPGYLAGNDDQLSHDCGLLWKDELKAAAATGESK